MEAKRRRHDHEFKARVALEALQGVVRQFHEHGWVLRIPRPWPLPHNDEQWGQKHAAFRPRLAALLADPQAVVFLQDECGIEGDPRPRSPWAMKGSHPITRQTSAHARLNILGAVIPAAIERLWLHFKSQWFAGFTARTTEVLMERINSRPSIALRQTQHCGLPMQSFGRRLLRMGLNQSKLRGFLEIMLTFVRAPDRTSRKSGNSLMPFSMISDTCSAIQMDCWSAHFINTGSLALGIH